MPTPDEYESVDAAIDDLADRYARYVYLQDVGNLVRWDQQVTMPEGGTPARAKQLGALSTASHESLTDPEIGSLLDAVEGSLQRNDGSLSDDAAIVREIRREYDRAASVPAELVAELSEHRAESQAVWRDARAAADYDAFAPRLEKLIDLERQRSAAIDPDRDPYVVQYEDRQPFLPLERVDAIFDELREHLVPLLDRIRSAGRTLPDLFEGTYDTAAQEALYRDALDLLGYDWDRGRLDVSAHPFTSGTQFDSRVTTRFDESSPIPGLLATVHEFGHATYQLGLRGDAYGSPLGQSRSAGVHESQSRFWENHVGRTKPFWELFLPTLQEHFPSLEDATVDELYAAVNRIYPENPIRVEADELTYHLHIILRCEIDGALVRGDLDVDEVPGVWNRKMDEYLGVVPETDAEGCLQDIHWSSGLAVFHGYTVGSVLAAQLDAAMREDLDVDGLIREGEFDRLREWHEEHVHRHGRRYPTDELIEEATGEPLTAEHFIEYVDEKFAELYGL
ncbi:carboxypeptidase M32 [Halovivax limisalsi]|uniref:carboxypeptidase M32 n=1 Tax=Halovivax limisalsi TaxID=1453760 RepID=UPI001FFCE6E9|nr:carboxypeptidase M32 [Halovivax limisalsi]